jgi:SH3-like domain-containing protein
LRLTRNFPLPARLRSNGFSATTASLLLVSTFTFATGCSSFKAKPADQYVYVTAKSANLRDRVAAVSNRTGQVSNGDRLKILDHGRHFLKVQTEKGEVGWIEEKAVATGQAAAEFDKLKEQHKADPEVASAVVRDAVYMHLKPGRESERFYLLAEGEKLRLLKRATLIKAVNPALVARAQKAIPQAAGSDAKRKDVPKPVEAAKSATPAEASPPPSMEDWWLVRDSQGHTGWLFARMMDVDAPESLTRYAEGQRIVGAYVLTTVHDEEAPGPVKDVPIYVTVLSPYKAGLPYDFDQIRVFTWSTSKHRYETGFREKSIEGYLPVVIGKMKDPYGKTPAAQAELPSFTYKLLPADAPAVTPDPDTGAMIPSQTITRTYRMEGNFMHRISQPGAQLEAEAHPVFEEKKGKKGKKR